VDYYTQGSLVAAVVALVIAVYLRAFRAGGCGGEGVPDLPSSSFCGASPSTCGRRSVDLLAQGEPRGVMFIPPFVSAYCGRGADAAAMAPGGLRRRRLGERRVSRDDLLRPDPRLSLVERRALLFVYPYLGAGLYVIVRHGFRDSPSSVERKKYQFLVVGGGIASLVAPLNFLPGTGIDFPPLAAFAVPHLLLLHGDGDPAPPLLRTSDIVGRGSCWSIQIFAFAVAFGCWSRLRRKFWFPLAGVFLISFFLLTFYPFLLRKLGGISADLLVRQSRRVQSVLSDVARKLPESTSLREIARTVEDALAQVPFVERASLWVRPEGGTDEGIGALPVRPDEYLRAFSRFTKRYPALRVMEHGGSKAADVADLGRLVRRLDPPLPAGGPRRRRPFPLERKAAVVSGDGPAPPLPRRDRAGGREHPAAAADPAS